MAFVTWNFMIVWEAKTLRNPIFSARGTKKRSHWKPDSEEIPERRELLKGTH